MPIFKRLFVVVFLFSVKLADATHIVGGEIYYDYLGGDNYKIYLKVYRDCINGIAPFDNPAVISIFDANNILVTSLNVPISSTITVQPSSNSPCAPITAGNACVEEAIYTATVNLPPKIGGYTIAYQRCCRNGTILNLINPGSTGTTYWEHIPGPEVVTVNNSPRFKNIAPIYICANSPISFNHMATDPDGDLLVYSFCDPFNGLSSAKPIILAGDSTNAPPYLPVSFISPYSSSYPISSSPAININTATGIINGSPNMLGQWVIGICVSEYRAGVLIGTHHRDFQFNIINCPFVVVADIGTQIATNNGFCNGMLYQLYL